MFSLRPFAYVVVVPLTMSTPALARPDFDPWQPDPNQLLTSLPLPPDPEPFSAVAVLDSAVGSSSFKNRSTLLPVIVREAETHGVPAAVADAVIRIESRYDPDAVGRVGEIGLMQVRPKTAAYMGFQGSPAELANPETNIRLGVTYLAKAWRLAGGDLCRALMKYRAGHSSREMSPLSVEYCRRARVHLAAIGAGPEMSSEPESTGSVHSPVQPLRPAGRHVHARSLWRAKSLASTGKGAKWLKRQPRKSFARLLARSSRMSDQREARFPKMGSRPLIHALPCLTGAKSAVQRCSRPRPGSHARYVARRW